MLAGDGDDWIDLRGVDSRFGEAKFEGFGTATGVAVLAGVPAAAAQPYYGEICAAAGPARTAASARAAPEAALRARA